jgi:hypothetical protein
MRHWSRWLRRSFRLRTVPGRIRTLTACAFLTLVGLSAGTGVGILQARDGLHTIGSGAGPEVVAASNLYLALSDMDAQVTTALLTGQEEGWLCEQSQSGCAQAPVRIIYEIRREEAQGAAMQAAGLTGGDGVRMDTVRAVLDGLHQYDQQVRAAMELARRPGGGLVPLPPDAVEPFRAASALMTDDLLPKAYNLALASGATVNSTYQVRRSATLSWRTGVAAIGLFAVLVLVGLQIYLAIRFRRLINPWLILATLGAIALTVACASLLVTEADYLSVAKTKGFDPVLTLSRTRALDKSMDADRGRSLLDPQDGDRYDQMYFDKAQTIFYISDAPSLGAYYAELNRLVDHYVGDSHTVTFGGFYGVAARAGGSGERELLGELLSDYRRYQDNDGRVRQLATDDAEEAAKSHMDPDWPNLLHPSFRAHDEGLAALVGRHQYIVDRTVLDGERAMAAWPWLLPVSVLVLGGLVMAGVRPRLKEFR